MKHEREKEREENHFFPFSFSKLKLIKRLIECSFSKITNSFFKLFLSFIKSVCWFFNTVQVCWFLSI